MSRYDGAGCVDMHDVGGGWFAINDVRGPGDVAVGRQSAGGFSVPGFADAGAPAGPGAVFVLTESLR